MANTNIVPKDKAKMQQLAKQRLRSNGPEGPPPSTRTGQGQAASVRDAQNAVRVAASSKSLAKNKMGEIASLAHGIGEAARNSRGR